MKGNVFILYKQSFFFLFCSAVPCMMYVRINIIIIVIMGLYGQ